MYGKHFESLYEGSMVGSGAVVFAVWGYVIAKMKPDKEVGAQVTLNARLLEAILGETEEKIQTAIEFLCAPDPRSRTKTEEGRRLVRLGEFDYRVVNGAKYRWIQDEDSRREQNRVAQAKHRMMNLLESLGITEEQAQAEIVKIYIEQFVRRRKDGRPFVEDLKAAAGQAGNVKALVEGFKEANAWEGEPPE